MKSYLYKHEESSCMRMLRASSDQDPSLNKSRRRFRGKRTDLASEQMTNTEPNMPSMNSSPHIPHQLPQELSSFQGATSPRPVLELDQLNQRQLLLHALVASSTSSSNIHRDRRLSPRGQTPSPAPSLSSTASSSHASSLETYRESATRSYVT